MDLRLAGLKTLVSGGSSGIGFAIARTLVDEGAQVALSARDPDRLDAAVAALEQAGTVIGIPVDVTAPDQANDAVQKAAERFGGLDLLVGCVGGHEGPRWMAEQSSAQWTSVLQLNVVQLADTVRAAIPHLRDHGRGSVLLIASVTGWRGGPTSVYAASKAAVIQLAATLAQELGPYQIRVNALSPGGVGDTEGWIGYRQDHPEDFAAFQRDDLPLGRLVTLQEVADVACLLLSPRGSGVNGANVAVDAAQQRAHAIRFPRDV